MKQIVNFSQFCDSFSDTYKNNFSYDGKRALFDYLEQYEEETGQEIELDPIALCCEYSEHESAEEAAKQYGYEAEEDDENDGLDEVERNEADRDAAIEWLEDRTTVIRLDNGGVIIQQF